jgi:ribosomal protein L19
MESVIQKINATFKKAQVVDVRSGDTVKVHQKIREGAKERIQIFQGLVIRTDRKDSHTSRITVRRIASGIGVEKSFMLHNPLIVKVEVTKRSKVRRNYLTYMRTRTGKSARMTGISITSQSSNETSFADKLRAVLRLDPDIVMVGEVRDGDTAKTALQAALTGHLVLSTFHASSAAAALSRLMDVIGQNPLFVSAIRLVMAQRLVRRLDDATKQPFQPDEATLSRIRDVISTLPADIERPNLETLQLFKPGSSVVVPYGYKGQVALREQFMMIGKVVEVLAEGRRPTTQDIEAAAIASGMRTMLQDGILKAIAGETTVEEIYRVVG